MSITNTKIICTGDPGMKLCHNSATPLPEQTGLIMIKVEPIPAFRDNYIWFIIHEPNRKVAIVDPGDATPVLEHISWTRSLY